MNLVIPSILLDIELSEDYAYELIIENENMFREIAGDLYSQINSNEGRLVLSQCGKEIAIAKYCEMIWNPFAVDFNNKKIVSSLYKEMQEISDTMYLDFENSVNKAVIEYLDSIICQMEYNLDYSYELDKFGLFKLFKVGICEEHENVVEKLIDYIKILKKVLGIEVVIFVNIKHYLDEGEIRELYKSARYEKIKIINIAGNETYQIVEEKCFLIDKDLCLLDLN